MTPKFTALYIHPFLLTVGALIFVTLCTNEEG